MIKLDQRTIANMDVALETVCRRLPNSGGDHETRKHIAKKLLQAARRGNSGLGVLEDIARRALDDLSRGRRSNRMVSGDREFKERPSAPSIDL